MRVWWALLGLSYGIGAGLYGNLTHFTWWTVLLFVGYCVCGAMGTRERVHVAWVAIALTVVMGVLTMSGMGCTMLRDTHSKMGPLRYGVGTWLVHFNHLAVALRYGVVPVAVHRQLAVAAGSYLLYIRLVDSGKVYGCETSSHEAVVGGLLWVGIFFYAGKNWVLTVFSNYRFEP